jgi:transaldolase
MSETTPTDYWNDSCAIDELTYGIEHGAVGATTNPVIVVDVLKKAYGEWRGGSRSSSASGRPAPRTTSRGR